MIAWKWRRGLWRCTSNGPPPANHERRASQPRMVQGRSRPPPGGPGGDPQPRLRHTHEYAVATVAGNLYVTIYDDWIACRFEEPERAKAISDTRLNPYSGKWNHHYDDAEFTSRARPAFAWITSSWNLTAICQRCSRDVQNLADLHAAYHGRQLYSDGAGAWPYGSLHYPSMCGTPTATAEAVGSNPGLPSGLPKMPRQ